jgi:hypothetical protein
VDDIVLKTLDIGDVALEFETDYVICRVCEGADLLGEQASRTCAEIEARMAGDFGVILDEVNAYSMRFEAMLELKNNARIRCMAVVAYRPVTYGTTKMAFYVIKKPYRIFSNLDDARVWMQGEMERKID